MVQHDYRAHGKKLDLVSVSLVWNWAMGVASFQEKKKRKKETGSCRYPRKKLSSIKIIIRGFLGLIM